MNCVRIAKEKDIDSISRMYDELCISLETSTNYCGWKLNLYPTKKVAEQGYSANTLYLIDGENNETAGSVILNTDQPKAYKNARWLSVHTQAPSLVVHTLAVHPAYLGKGIASQLLDFAEHLAKEKGFRSIRLDTYEKNTPASNLYEKKGYTLTDLIYLSDEEFEETRDWKFKCYEKLM